MKKNHETQILQALEQYRFVYNIGGKIDPDRLYRLTTYGGMPAIQQDPDAPYFGMFGAELLNIIGKHFQQKICINADSALMHVHRNKEGR